MATKEMMSIKLMINPDSNKVIFAESSKDFADFLIFLLSLPIGTAVKLLTSESMVGSFGNVYNSVANLNETYLQPNINKNFILKPVVCSSITNIPLSISGSSIISCRKLYNCGQRDYYYCNRAVTNIPNGAYCPGCSRKMNHEIKFLVASDNVGPSFNDKDSKGYVKQEASYMITDDLSVSVISTTSILSMMNEFNVTKLEERNVKIGNEEALELLKTTFKSTTVLSDVFLKRKKNEEEEQGGESKGKAGDTHYVSNSGVIVKGGESKTKADNSLSLSNLGDIKKGGQWKAKADNTVSLPNSGVITAGGDSKAGGESNAKADNTVSLSNSGDVMKEDKSKAKADNTQQQQQQQQKRISSRLSVKREQKDGAFASKKQPAAKKAKTVQKPNKPKRPATAYSIFMEEFRKAYEQENPNNKSAVGKAASEKWRQMSGAEKAPYQAESDKRKTDYQKELKEYKKTLADDGARDEEADDDEDRSGEDEG